VAAGFAAVAGIAVPCCAQTDSVTRSYDLCAPTYPGGGTCPSIPIPDFPGPAATATLVVPSDPGQDLIASVTPAIWIQHTFQGDLRVELISPAGTVVTLLNQPGVTSGVPAGFSADDFGGFEQCLLGGSGFHFQPMSFRDSGFNTCTFTDYFTSRYDQPAVAYPGIAFSPPPTRNCIQLPCTGDVWGPWAPVTPLSALIGQSKAGAWTLRVTDLDSGDTGFIRYFGLIFDITTQPTAGIIAPGPFSCVCNGAQITGTATDAGGSIQGYQLEWATSPAGPWMPIASGTSPVVNGLLGTWNTTGVPQGFNYLRLTVANIDGTQSQFVTLVLVDQSFSDFDVRVPTGGTIVGGVVCTDGTMAGSSNGLCFQSYQVDYAAGPTFSTFLPVNPATPVYTTPVVNDPLANWNTLNGPAAVPDGPYRLRFRGTTACGHVNETTRDVIVDNTPPVALITDPSPCGYVCGSLQVMGTASDAHLAAWTLQYTGGDSHGWVTIASGTSSVVNGVLGTWDTSSLARCAYTLRLVVSDQAWVDCTNPTRGNVSEYDVSLNVGAYANCDNSTSAPRLNVNDFICFQAQFAAGANCPQ
jgi:hypothetical protein